jgi:rod shape-determining protein MreD
MNNAPGGAWVIISSVACAMVLQVIPLPLSLESWRPDWIALTVIYWTLALPHRMGVVSAWGIGIVQDLLLGTLLGQHALALALNSFIAARLHRQIRLFPLWQQCILVAALLSINQFLFAWINGIQGLTHPAVAYWGPLLTGGTIWILVFTVLRKLRRSFFVH